MRLFPVQYVHLLSGVSLEFSEAFALCRSYTCASIIRYFQTQDLFRFTSAPSSYAPTQMAPSKISSQRSTLRIRARTSKQEYRGNTLRTPALLLPTYRGQVPYLPLPLLPVAPNEAFALSVSAADLAVLNAKTGLSASSLAGSHGVDSFAKLASLPTNALVMLVLRGAGGEAPQLRVRDSTISVHSRAARVNLSAKQLAELHVSLRTDLLEGASGCASGAHAVEQFAISAAVEIRRVAAPCSVITGAHIAAGTDAARNAMQIGDAGVSVAGAYSGESPETRFAIVNAAAEGAHPAGLVVVPGGNGEPSEFLNLVRAGADIVETRFPYECATIGEAVDFARGVRVLVRDASFSTSKEPLVEGCACGVCASYSRAYLNHLYGVHEMLAPTLIAKHNVWCYLRWVENVRSAIEAGAFDDMCSRFFSRRALQLAQGVPRGLLPL